MNESMKRQGNKLVTEAGLLQTYFDLYQRAIKSIDCTADMLGMCGKEIMRFKKCLFSRFLLFFIVSSVVIVTLTLYLFFAGSTAALDGQYLSALLNSTIIEILQLFTLCVFPAGVYEKVMHVFPCFIFDYFRLKQLPTFCATMCVYQMRGLLSSNGICLRISTEKFISNAF